ncbi:MAG: hypothetical protein J0H06_01675 [Actinobacteria bacterium]|nr:hypothetical protein [Actinomycetota bacterium]
MIPRPGVQPGVEVPAMQPEALGGSWRSRPVRRLRMKVTTPALPLEVAYTLRPSGLTATELAPSRPIARPQPWAEPFAR